MPGAEYPPTHRWFALPLEVRGVPATAAFVSVSCPLDFTDLLARLRQRGVVDTRTLRLFRLDPAGQELEIPYQFSPDEQPRMPATPERRLLPATPEHVTWLAEWRADDTPAPVRVAGQLTWIVAGSPQGVARYRLVFGVPRTGLVVQVPFPPYNLHCFDATGRPTPMRWFPRLEIRPQWPLHSTVSVFDTGTCVLTYHTGPFDRTPPTEYPVGPRRPYLYPVCGPDGIGLTELGKPHDPSGSHAHHYSLWVAHARVQGVDFWTERGGRICHRRFALLEDGPLCARVIQQAVWVPPGTAEPILEEQRSVTLYATPPSFRLIDLTVEFRAAGNTPVELGQTPFGFLAVRVKQSMTVFDGAGEIVNASGQRGEAEANWQRAEWLDLSGPIAPDRWGGVALFDHPANPYYPTVWHCRNDGWAGAAFTFQAPWTILPDQPLCLRYRIVLHQQDATGGEVARRYTEYACRPAVVCGEPSPVGE